MEHAEYLSANSVRKLFDDISTMTLSRWRRYRDFPEPRVVAGRNFWRREDVLAWAESHVGNQQPARPQLDEGRKPAGGAA